MGYCLIDTVTEYENEAAVGRVIATNTTLVTKFFHHQIMGPTRP